MLDSRSQDERESNDVVSSQETYKKDAIRIEKETDERIEITDSSHDHDKSSSSSRSSSSSSSSSSSDDESREVKKKDDDKKTGGDSVSEVVALSSVPDQPVPIADDAPFIGATANVIVESTSLMDSTTPGDLNSGELIEIAHVDHIISNESDENSLPKPNEIAAEVSVPSDEIRQASSGATDSDVKENEGKTWPLPESTGVTEGSKESEVVISHEEEVFIVNLFDLVGSHFLSLMLPKKKTKLSFLSGSRATNTWSSSKNLMVKLLWLV